jgi:hypothetical protein
MTTLAHPILQAQEKRHAAMPMADYTIRLLHFEATVRAAPTLIESVRHMFPPSPSWSIETPRHPPLRYRIDPPGSDSMWRITENDTVTNTAADEAQLLGLLEWSINTRAVDTLSSHYLMFHAAALACGNRGLLLAARSGSGKSTLAAALIAEGFTYFSDEAGIVSRDDAHVLPFAKSVTVKPGSLAVLEPLFPELGREYLPAGQRGVARRYLRPPHSAWPSEPADLRIVLFPCYLPGAGTKLDPLSRSEGFARLLAHSFSARQHPGPFISRIIDLVQRTHCYDLQYSDLSSAVAVVRQLIASDGVPAHEQA